MVGFLGDGINDSLSLIAADVGISVDTAAEMAAEAAKHPNANLLWVQDEPANQGPWPFIALRTAEQFGGEGFGGRNLRRVSRRATAAPATGDHHLHEEEQKSLLMEAFTR